MADLTFREGFWGFRRHVADVEAEGLFSFRRGASREGQVPKVRGLLTDHVSIWRIQRAFRPPIGRIF